MCSRRGCCLHTGESSKSAKGKNGVVVLSSFQLKLEARRTALGHPEVLKVFEYIKRTTRINVASQNQRYIICGNNCVCVHILYFPEGNRRQSTFCFLRTVCVETCSTAMSWQMWCVVTKFENRRFASMAAQCTCPGAHIRMNCARMHG